MQPDRPVREPWRPVGFPFAPDCFLGDRGLMRGVRAPVSEALGRPLPIGRPLMCSVKPLIIAAL
jgi:hypothetical protein